MKNVKCCFCGKECENEFGNNPAPVNNDPNARCCNECNDKIVIPARILNVMKPKENEEEK